MKIFEIKIMPTIRYGLECVSARLAKSSLQTLDKCKLLYLKSILGVSKHTSNTFVLTLTQEKTLCEQLKEPGYEFDESAWKAYLEELERKRTEFDTQEYADGPAFRTQGCKLENRKNRALVCRMTYHGYHHKIFTNEDFYDKSCNDGQCKYCEESRINRYHILECIYFKGRTISEIVGKLLP